MLASFTTALTAVAHRNHAVRFQLTERKADPLEGISVLTEANPVCKMLGLPPFVCQLILTFRSREAISLVQDSAEYAYWAQLFLMYWILSHPPTPWDLQWEI